MKLKELLTEFRKAKKEGERIKFCPKCGSTNMRSTMVLMSSSNEWKCNKCGFKGIAFEGDAEFIKKYREKLKEGKK